MRRLAVCFVLLVGMAGARPALGADAVRGKALFELCSACHDPASAERKVGPGLKGLFKRARLLNRKPVTEKNVRAVIDEGARGMPAFRDMLSEQEKDDLIAYLRTL